MSVETTTIDRTGRIILPETVLTALGISPSQETEVVIELTETGILIKPKPPRTSITERIAAMELPVADSDEMEQEIEAGRLS
jgi:bifunctional DNA-binding transcriptional regulator/antitoxin component of YhaV-PrlF toxin-antitoxin module